MQTGQKIVSELMSLNYTNIAENLKKYGLNPPKGKGKEDPFAKYFKPFQK